MIVTGRRCPSARATAVLPTAVGPTITGVRGRSRGYAVGRTRPIGDTRACATAQPPVRPSAVLLISQISALTRLWEAARSSVARAHRVRVMWRRAAGAPAPAPLRDRGDDPP